MLLLLLAFTNGAKISGTSQSGSTSGASQQAQSGGSTSGISTQGHSGGNAGPLRQPPSGGTTGPPVGPPSDGTTGQLSRSSRVGTSGPQRRSSSASSYNNQNRFVPPDKVEVETQKGPTVTKGQVHIGENEIQVGDSKFLRTKDSEGNNIKVGDAYLVNHNGFEGMLLLRDGQQYFDLISVHDHPNGVIKGQVDVYKENTQFYFNGATFNVFKDANGQAVRLNDNIVVVKSKDGKVSLLSINGDQGEQMTISYAAKNKVDALYAAIPRDLERFPLATKETISRLKSAESLKDGNGDEGPYREARIQAFLESYVAKQSFDIAQRRH